MWHRKGSRVSDETLAPRTWPQLKRRKWMNAWKLFLTAHDLFTAKAWFYFQELLLNATLQRGFVSKPEHLLCRPGRVVLFFSVLNPDATRTRFDREPDRLQKIPFRIRIVWLKSLFIMTLNTSLSSWTNTKNNPVCVCSAYHSHALHPRDWAGGGWWVCSMMCHCRFSLCWTQQHKTHTHPLLMT